MVRLTTPSGATVNVPADKAKRLIAAGYKAADKKAPAKKAASSKSKK